MQRTRYFLLFTTILLVQNVSFGQSRQRWSVGPRLGLNLTNFTGVVGPTITADSRTNQLFPGLSAGVGFMYSDMSRFGFAADVLYSQRGSHNAYGDQSLNYRINYLEVPITARYFLTKSGNFRPNIYGGVVPALYLSHATIVKGGSIDVIPEPTNPYRIADVGLTAGFQANFRTGASQRFTLDARYTYGITALSKLNNDLRNQMITVGLGYNFGIGREYQPGDRKLPIRNR